MNYVLSIVVLLSSIHFLSGSNVNKYESNEYVVVEDYRYNNDRLRDEYTNLNKDYIISSYYSNILKEYIDAYKSTNILYKFVDYTNTELLEKLNSDLSTEITNEYLKRSKLRYEYEQDIKRDINLYMENISNTIYCMRRDLALKDLFVNSYNIDRNPNTNWVTDLLELGEDAGEEYLEYYKTAFLKFLLPNRIDLNYLILAPYLSVEPVPYFASPPKNIEFIVSTYFSSPEAQMKATNYLKPVDYMVFMDLLEEKAKSDDFVINSLIFFATNNLQYSFFDEFKLKKLVRDFKREFKPYLREYRTHLHKHLMNLKDSEYNINTIFLKNLFYSEDRLDYRDEFGKPKIELNIREKGWLER